MKPQTFRNGDRVQRQRTLQTGTIIKCRYETGGTTPALIRGQMVLTQVSERWFYQVDGDGFHPSHWFAEDILVSAQPCPNCQTIGWNWIVGCPECSLCPEDLR